MRGSRCGRGWRRWGIWDKDAMCLPAGDVSEASTLPLPCWGPLSFSDPVYKMGPRTAASSWGFCKDDMRAVGGVWSSVPGGRGLCPKAQSRQEGQRTQP